MSTKILYPEGHDQSTSCPARGGSGRETLRRRDRPCRSDGVARGAEVTRAAIYCITRL